MIATARGAPLAAEAAQPVPEPPPAAPRLADVSVYERGAGWRKPVDTPCAECGGCHDPTQTLLCDGDGCDRAYHLSCLKPPLEHVPAGKWLCPGCTERWNASALAACEPCHPRRQRPCQSMNCSRPWMAKASAAWWRCRTLAM